MKNKELVIDFLNHLKGSSIMQISTLDRPVKFADAIDQKGMYFCGGLKHKPIDENGRPRRCGDDDIGKKKYCMVDIDIRNDHYLATGKILSAAELSDVIGNVIVLIEEAGFGDYCALVNSGNGLHVYRSGEEREFDREVYSSGVGQIQKIINSSIGKLGYVCDFKCKNLSRITRLPGSLNPRSKDTQNIKYNLGAIEVDLLFFEPRDSETFSQIEFYADLNRQDEEKEKKEMLKARDSARTHQAGNTSGIWGEIYKIPVEEIAEYIWGVSYGEENSDGVITLKEPHKNMGAYVYKPGNVLVHGGSSLIKTKKNRYTPFELVCDEICGGDEAQAVQWFKDRYHIRDKNDKTPEKYERLFSKIGYRYPGQDMENEFGCIVSGELVLIAAATNKGKTSFGLNILKQNKDQKVGLVNMEFEISDTFRFQYLRGKGYKDSELKAIGTNLRPIEDEFAKEIQEYVDARMIEISTHNLPQDVDVDVAMEKLYSLGKEGYSMIMFDSLSSVKGGNTNEGQEQIVKKLRNFCTDTGITIILIHHFNKGGKSESGSQKISDLSNVHINIHFAQDAHDKYYRVFILKKDKPHSKEIEFHGYLEQQGTYSLVPHGIQDTDFLSHK